MRNLNNLVKNYKQVFPFVISLFFGLLIIFISNDSINRDGVGYIIQANLISLNGTDSLMGSAMYSDPFFPNLLVKIHNIFELSLRNSSLLFNFCCLIISSLSFFGILKLISKKNLILWLGLLVFISSVPLFDRYLMMTIRDHGMWAALLATSFYLILFSLSKKNIYLLITIVLILIASFFRSESIVFLIVPIFLYAYKHFEHTRYSQMLKVLAIVLIGISFLLSLIILSSFWPMRFFELFDRFILMIKELATELPIKTNHIWLNGHLNDYPLGIKFSLLGYIYFKKWLFGLGLPCIVFGYIGFKSKMINKEISLILVSLIVLSSVLVFFNFLSTFSLTSRYFMFSYLLIYIFVTVGLYEFINKRRLTSRCSRYFGNILLLLLVFQVIGNVYDKQKINSEKITAQWLENNNIDINEVFLPDLRIRYYLNELNFEEKNIEDAAIISQINYIVLSQSNLSLIRKLDKFEPVMSVPNQSKAKIIIYKRKP